MDSPQLKPGWNKPEPSRIPRPTWWPAALAFAITLILWGPVTSVAMAVTGAILAVVSIAGWVREIRNE